MKSKKILFISNISGKEISSFSIASIRSSQSLGFEFHIACNFSASSLEQRFIDEKKYNIKIHHIEFERNPLRLKNIKAYKQLSNLILRERFDVIHCNTPIGGLCGRIAAWSHGIKNVIYQVHGFHFYKGAPFLNWCVYYPVERFLANFTDILITINSEDYNLGQSWMFWKPRYTYLVPGVGIDSKRFRDVAVDCKEYRESLNLKDSDIVLLSVGRLDSNKNNKTIIEAISMIDNPDVKLLICGIGEQEEELKKLTTKLQLDNRVIFLGLRNDMPELYKVSDIFVLASFREGLSRAIMEAMASGLPCVVSNIRGNNDLIVDNEGGFLADPFTATDFYDKIIILLDESLRLRMGEYNINRSCKYNIDNILKNLRTIYSQYL